MLTELEHKRCVRCGGRLLLKFDDLTKFLNLEELAMFLNLDELQVASHINSMQMNDIQL
jgi:hypothetical protein